MRTLKSFSAGAGLLVAGAIMGGILTFASLLIMRPVTCSADSVDPACIYDGGDVIVAWRGFPFGVTESPAAHSQDCNIVERCYPYYHSGGAIADVCIWTVISYGMIGLYVIGLRKGERD